MFKPNTAFQPLALTTGFLSKVRANAYLAFSEPGTIQIVLTHLNIIIISSPFLQKRKRKQGAVIQKVSKGLSQESKPSSLVESCGGLARNPSGRLGSALLDTALHKRVIQPIIRC